MVNRKMSIALKHLEHLVGMELNKLYFAGDMSMWRFSSAESEIQFHVQSSYRFTYEYKTILCRSDYNEIVNKEKFNSLLHTERDLLYSYIFPLRVINVELFTNQDVKITFDNDFSLYIYADDNTGYEQWRFWEEFLLPHKTEQVFVAINGTIQIQQF